uniref:GH18 domain-containing protein n=1 Tax=Urocitellus parryii TaxID=9999 RepID=A0A8D2IHH0_UROPR
IVSTTADCKTVISSAIDFLHQDGFDGMNLDIEHSEFWGSPTEDKQQFAILSNLRMKPQLSLSPRRIYWKYTSICRNPSILVCYVAAVTKRPDKNN